MKKDHRKWALIVKISVQKIVVIPINSPLLIKIQRDRRLFNENLKRKLNRM